MNDEIRLKEDQARFEELYYELYPRVQRIAAIQFRRNKYMERYNEGHIEEVIQETFSVAWMKREDYFNSPSPIGWLIKALDLKIREMRRDERTWTKRILRFSEYVTVDSGKKDTYLRAEMLSIISEEEYHILKRLYLDGYTYRELSAQLGVKQSALAMRVKRIKERISRAYQD